MPEPAPNPDLMRSLGRLVRGLSALFWGLPLALVVSVQSALTDWLRPLGMWPPLLATGLLFYGVVQMAHFQKQERVWQEALAFARIFSVINLGLTPFLYWWSRLPQEPLFLYSVGVLMLSGLLFLWALNAVLQRLTAMLPDETLRIETKFFTTVNRYLLFGVVIILAALWFLSSLETLPGALLQVLQTIERERRWMLLFLVLLPVATTMALIWKIKEVVLASVFGQEL